MPTFYETRKDVSPEYLVDNPICSSAYRRNLTQSYLIQAELDKPNEVRVNGKLIVRKTQFLSWYRLLEKANADSPKGQGKANNPSDSAYGIARKCADFQLVYNLEIKRKVI